MNNRESTLRALILEYLFVSLFSASAESLACENASLLTAMQRAENYINEQREGLNLSFHRLRQGDIDEEFFDVISGFEALRQVNAMHTGIMPDHARFALHTYYQTSAYMRHVVLQQILKRRLSHKLFTRPSILRPAWSNTQCKY